MVLEHGRLVHVVGCGFREEGGLFGTGASIGDNDSLLLVSSENDI